MKQILSQNYALIQTLTETLTLDHPTTIYTNDDVTVEIASTDSALQTIIAGLATAKFQTIPNAGEKCEYKKVYAYGTNKVRCEQEHTRMAFTPEQTPALWTVIATVAGYPAWKQPTGAHDAYHVGDRVSFNGSNYESKINANVWSPTAYPAGWKKL